MFPVVVPNIHQTDSTKDKYDTAGNDGYKYQQLVDSSSNSNSESSLNLYETTHDETADPNYLPKAIPRSSSDQKLPNASSFIYVNKNGHAVQAQVTSPKRQYPIEKPDLSKIVPKGNEMICNAFLVQLAKSNVNKENYSQLKTDYESFKDVESTVPTIGNENLNKSDSLNEKSPNNSLVQQTNQGLRINTSLAIDEPNVEITYDHVKYINIFTVLFCWCFPFTGIAGIVYARLTAKYYKLRDLNKANFYLKRSEWMLIATFFFGFTIISIGFTYLQHYVFTDLKVQTSRFGNNYLTHLPTFMPK